MMDWRRLSPEEAMEMASEPSNVADSDQNQARAHELFATLMTHSFAIQECLEEGDPVAAYSGSLKLMDLIAKQSQMDMMVLTICMLGQVMEQIRFRLLPDASMSELNDFLRANRDAVTYVGSMANYKIAGAGRTETP
jgi:hypothetical protein